MARPVIKIEGSSTQMSVAEEIEAHLLAALSVINAQTTNDMIVLAARDEAGTLIGGLLGATSYGWFLVKTIWVSEAMRGHGIGRDLMMLAEEQARRLDCHGAWLDTSNAAARTFYLNLGYSDFAVLENGPDRVPVAHKRWFMKKSL